VNRHNTPAAPPAPDPVAAPKEARSARVYLEAAELTVPGMGSDHCAGIVSTSLRRLAGVGDVHTSIASHRVRVDFDPARVDAERLRAAVERAGYEVAAVEAPDRQRTGTAEEIRLVVPGMGSDHCAGLVKDSLQRLAGVGEIRTNISSHQVMIAAVESLPPVPHHDPDDAMHMFWRTGAGLSRRHRLLAFPVVFLYGGWATHRSAWRSLTNRTANMDVLISMGSLPPYLVGLVGFFYPMTSFIEMAATIMTFHLIGRYLETRPRDAPARRSSADHPWRQDGQRRARRPGGRGAGRRTPARRRDGGAAGRQDADRRRDRRGRSHLDESIATGRIDPGREGPRRPVIGATMNKEGMLKVRATRIGADTFLSQVIRLVEEAQGSKVPIQEFADRITGPLRAGGDPDQPGEPSCLAALRRELRPILTWGAGLPALGRPDG
jgi:P-type Cu+ transporter